MMTIIRNFHVRALSVAFTSGLLAWLHMPMHAADAPNQVKTSPNWPSFRGADSRGVADHPGLPERWSATENVEWKVDLKGRGWSSPIVWGDKVFLTTVINQAGSETPQKGIYARGNLPIPKTVHEWWVYCLDLKSGKHVWGHKVHEAAPESAIHSKNSFASETPVTDGERVYFYFGNLGLFVYTMEGESVWEKRFRARETSHGWGTAASPVLHQDRLYLVNDNEEDSWLLALNKRTGKEVWKVEREEKSNWCTPYIWENSQRTEIITPGSDMTRSYDLSGKLLWFYKEGMSRLTIAMPYSDGDLLYISSGFMNSTLKPIYAILPGAHGDITLDRGDTSSKFVAWCQWKAAPYNPSTLLYHERLYVVLDRGLFSVLDPKSGEIIYDRERISGRNAFTSSPWAYNGKIFCLNEDGATLVFKEGDSFSQLHTNLLADDDMCLATPAIAEDRLLVRTSQRLYCIRKK
ncbi:MAG TPA: serine/threonine protein kinase [Verrucomicrobiales bacterium]|nr:serine/threonine protein kinase [Verrucomicrobiales bacterium]HIL69193.1 serine/threonine protein kinase [Verrucomicrobiota bacterium]